MRSNTTHIGPAGTRILQSLHRDLANDSEVIDREHITKWLMMFSAKKPLKLHHPRMGNISFEGIKFSGSCVQVFDRYILLTVEDFVETHVKEMEMKLIEADDSEVERVAEAAASRIILAKQSLLERAAEIKGRLLGNGLSSRPAKLLGGIESVTPKERLVGRSREIVAQRAKETGGKPLFGRLERFAKANPALYGIVCGTVGFVLGLAVERLT